MSTTHNSLRDRVVLLRRQGKTYREIQKLLHWNVPKATLSYWCRAVTLTKQHRDRIRDEMMKNLQRAGKKSIQVRKMRQAALIEGIIKNHQHLIKILRDKDTSKIGLAILYAAEGSRCVGRQSLMFGNSDSQLIRLFLSLLRRCYPIEEKKFRCTVQCRADQDGQALQRYWSRVTKIPRAQFYASRIDPRTKGKPTKQIKYKGVCRIDYLSAKLLMELKQVIELLCSGV